MIKVLFSAGAERWVQYEQHLRSAFETEGLDVDLTADMATPPETVDYMIFVPKGPLQDFTPYSRLKAVLNLWAGVETVVGNKTLSVPLCRMVDPALTDGMVEWVTGHVLRHHLGMDTHILHQDGVWRNDTVPPLASERTVCVLGLGALGAACAQQLAQLNFNVTGWSRSPKQIDSITSYSGAALNDALAQAQIVVLLLPLTSGTVDILNAKTLAMLPKGAVIINPGRGGLIDDDALIAALDSGHVGHATLDVFRTEPLPAEDPYWAHPNVTVTPHIASETRPASASKVVAENIRRGEAGLPFLHQVDRDAGY